MNSQTIYIPFDEELIPAETLTTGKLSCIYEHGRLRYLKYGDTEVIRMIYFAVRDDHWRTAISRIEHEKIESTENGFSISYTSFHQLGDISYRADVIIQAEDATVSFHVKGSALSSFKRNRIGICVHHPVKECEGKKVVITRPNGTEYTGRFPDLIAPFQSFREIKKMQWPICETLTTELMFEGDIFETEDQRNWGDSSFKTYSTPLDIPFPVTVNKGDIVQQKLDFRIIGEEEGKGNPPSSPKESRIPFPKIGYGSVHKEQLTKKEIELLQQIPFDHYRAELLLFSDSWESELSKRFEEVRQLNTKLELILFFNDHYKDQFARFNIAIKEKGNFIESILVLQKEYNITPPTILETVFQEIKNNYPHIQVGYGTDGFFADLNRNRPVVGDNYDFVSFSLNPQVHADDTLSLIENLERQADIIETTRSIAPGKQIHISPITFKIRVGENQSAEHPADEDSRQHQAFGAYWTLASMRNLGEAGHLTFYQVKGYRGILHDNKPFNENSLLYQALKKIKAFNPAWIIKNDNLQKWSARPIVFENDEGERLEFVWDGVKNFD